MPETQIPIKTPLAALHRKAGARMGTWFGCELPDAWGEPHTEQGFANSSVALIDKNYRAYLSFTGPDRVRYLNAILTNNIKDLPTGRGNVSLLLNPQGRILAEIETYALPDSLFCVSYSIIRQRLIEWLDKYIIMDDVTLTDDTDRWGALALEGPKAAAVVHKVSGIDIAPLGELSVTDADVASIPCRIVKRSSGGIPGAEFLLERPKLELLWKFLEDAVHQQGGGPVGYTALNAQRLAQGVPWFGYDFGEKQIPHEAGLQESHISYTKGCYTGQEIVERVRSRGQVNRRRVRLLFSGDAVPEAGSVLTLDGKEVGFVTRAAQSWYPPRIIGMGYVRKEGQAEGSKLQCESGTATLMPLP